MVLVFFKTIFYFFFSITYIYSIAGYGKILVNTKIPEKKTFNFFELKIYGLILQLFIAFILHLTIGTSEYINIIILLFGLILYFFYKKKLNQITSKYILLLLVLIFSVLLISKTHEDFIGYHLFSIQEIFNNQIRIGVSKLNFRFLHSSLLIYPQSLMIFPFFSFEFVHLPIFLLYFSTIGYFLYICYYTINNSERFFSLFIILILLIKFNRLSEFGYDYISQYLLIIVFHKLYFYNSNKYELVKAIKIFFFSILIKPICLLFLPILFILFYNNKVNYVFNLYSSKFILFSSMLAILISSSFLRTGCIFYPINTSCFTKEKIFWSEKKSIKEYSEVVSLWAKSFYSQEKSKYPKILDKELFKKNFNWLKFWIEGHFFYKISEFLIILISIILLIHIYFTREKPKIKKLLTKDYLIFLLSLLSILFWIMTVPQFRFGFASIIIFIYLFFKKFFKMEIIFDKKKVYSLIVFSLLILNTKNLNRISNEINREDIYKFINFPFYNQLQIENKMILDIDENKLKKEKLFHIEILK